jgi:hypothetical protein
MAIPGGATTEIGEAGLALDRVDHALRREARDRAIRRAAGLTAVVAGLLAAVLLWLVFGGVLDETRQTRPDVRPDSPLAPAGEPPLRANPPAGTAPGEG